MQRNEGEPRRSSRLDFLRKPNVIYPVATASLFVAAWGAIIAVGYYSDESEEKIPEPSYTFSRISDHIIEVDPQEGSFDEAVKKALAEIDTNCGINGFGIGQTRATVLVENADLCLEELR